MWVLLARFMRGVWKCLREADVNHKRYWIKTGKTPPKNGCNRWNVYIGRRELRASSIIDVRCKFCDRRKKFQASRRDGRGRLRYVKFYLRPDHMPHKALLEEVRTRNKLGDIDDVVEGFVKGSELI
jgi:hypothetical protein